MEKITRKIIWTKYIIYFICEQNSNWILICILKSLVGQFFTYEWRQNFEIYVNNAAITVLFLKWEQYTNIKTYSISATIHNQNNLIL